MDSKQRTLAAAAAALLAVVGAASRSLVSTDLTAVREASEPVHASGQTQDNLRRARARPMRGVAPQEGVSFLEGDEVHENYNPPVVRSPDEPAVEINAVPDGLCGGDLPAAEPSEPFGMPAPNMRQASQDEEVDLEARGPGSIEQPSALLAPQPSVRAAQREYLERAAELATKGASEGQLAELKATLLADESVR